MTEQATESPAATIRRFLRANSALPGAMEANDALRDLEELLQAATGERQREEAYSAAIVVAQREIQPAYKDKFVSKAKGGWSGPGKGPGVNVAETQQILDLARDVMAKHELALEVGTLEIVPIGGAPFMRVRYGLRHVAGYVHSVSRDFPLGNNPNNPDTVRGANTSALGYFLIDAFALPRREADSLEAEAERNRARTGGAATSGPRRTQGRSAETTNAAVTSGRSDGEPSTAQAAGSPAPCEKPTAEQMVERIGKMTDAGLTKMETLLVEWRDDSLDGHAVPYTTEERAKIAEAVKTRRTAL